MNIIHPIKKITCECKQGDLGFELRHMIDDEYPYNGCIPIDINGKVDTVYESDGKTYKSLRDFPESEFKFCIISCSYCDEPSWVHCEFVDGTILEDPEEVFYYWTH